jgi:hypothetical protein
MRNLAGDPGRGVALLVRSYPKSWRSRYGDEFTELLLAEVAERPHSFRRTVNVIRSGMVARLTCAGLSGHVLPPAEQARASLASLGCAVAAFLTFGAAIWAQLAIGWQWSEPNTSATVAAMIVMTIGIGILLALALAATVPIVAHIARRFLHRQSQGLHQPVALFLGAVAVLVVGSRHFGNGWPGTGGHPWGHQGLVPGGAAAFTWAMTLSVTSYWAHPAGLLSFPATEIAWMLVSPGALVCAVVGVTKVIRRLDISPRLFRFEMVLAECGALLMIVVLGGACSWIVNGGAGPRNLFHTGAIDIAGVVVMFLSIAVSYRASHRAHLGGLLTSSR